MEQIKFISDAMKHVYWSLLLQGLAFVVLAVLVLLYPALLFGLVAATFLLIGMFLIGLAWRIRVFWVRLPRILK